VQSRNPRPGRSSLSGVREESSSAVCCKNPVALIRLSTPNPCAAHHGRLVLAIPDGQSALQPPVRQHRPGLVQAAGGSGLPHTQRPTPGGGGDHRSRRPAIRIPTGWFPRGGSGAVRSLTWNTTNRVVRQQRRGLTLGQDEYSRCRAEKPMARAAIAGRGRPDVSHRASYPTLLLSPPSAGPLPPTTQ